MKRLRKDVFFGGEPPCNLLCRYRLEGRDHIHLSYTVKMETAGMYVCMPVCGTIYHKTLIYTERQGDSKQELRAV
jgi:hypothetical protein